MPIATQNPATGETLRTFDSFTQGEIESRLARAASAFRNHRLASFASRSACMRRAGEILIEERQRLGELMTLEMGKPIGAAVAEAEKCATACFYYADNAETLLSSYDVPT